MKRALSLIVLVLAVLAGAVVALNLRGEDPVPEVSSQPAPRESGPKFDALIARGKELTTAGNCMTCHTARGGVPWTGGRGVETPFGTIYAPNLTPDTQTGLGKWTAAHFWRALHNGRSFDGRLLYPAFPYPNYTHITREDSDAMFAFLQSLPPAEQPSRQNTLRVPYSSQAALAVWRALFFSPGTYRPDAAQSAEWNRGAYLVQGLGHCNACHASRNALGAPSGTLDLSGGLIPMQNWYAPSLAAADEAGVADWPLDDIVALLKAGVTSRGSVLGPMAEVVSGSTQHMADADLRSMAVYLKSLPPAPVAAPHAEENRDLAVLERGARIYTKQCAQCHGDNGEGVPRAYPSLAGNRAVVMDPPANLVRIILAGGFPPATAGNPRPYGMPPFATTLTNDDIAAVASHIRTAWGNRGAVVTPLEVNRYRQSVGQ